MFFFVEVTMLFPTLLAFKNYNHELIYIFCNIIECISYMLAIVQKIKM